MRRRKRPPRPFEMRGISQPANVPDPVKVDRPPAPPVSPAPTPIRIFGASTVSSTSNASALCPDLLRLEDIGEADAWRGKVVRGFFRVLRVVTGV